MTEKKAKPCMSKEAEIVNGLLSRVNDSHGNVTLVDDEELDAVGTIAGANYKPGGVWVATVSKRPREVLLLHFFVEQRTQQPMVSRSLPFVERMDSNRDLQTKSKGMFRRAKKLAEKKLGVSLAALGQ